MSWGIISTGIPSAIKEEIERSATYQDKSDIPQFSIAKQAILDFLNLVPQDSIIYINAGSFLQPVTASSKMQLGNINIDIRYKTDIIPTT
jgi:hypothetical protein